MTSMKSAFAGAALLVGLMTGPAFAQTGPAGTWDIVLDSPQGAQNMTIVVNVNGDKADGTVTSAIGTMPVSGTAKPNSFEVTGNLEIQGMSLPLTITGNTSADAVEGNMKVGDFGEFPFKGNRAAAKAAEAASAAPAAPASPAVATTGVGGKWNVTLILTGMGEFPLTANLTQNGEDVTGSLVSMMGEINVKGTFKVSTLNLEFTADTPQGPMQVTMTGELKDQAMTGKASIAGMGEAEWKAVR